MMYTVLIVFLLVIFYSHQLRMEKKWISFFFILSDQGHHYLPFHLPLLDKFLFRDGKTSLFEFRDYYSYHGMFENLGFLR